MTSTPDPCSDTTAWRCLSGGSWARCDTHTATSSGPFAPERSAGSREPSVDPSRPSARLLEVRRKDLVLLGVDEIRLELLVGGRDGLVVGEAVRFDPGQEMGDVRRNRSLPVAKLQLRGLIPHHAFPV